MEVKMHMLQVSSCDFSPSYNSHEVLQGEFWMLTLAVLIICSRITSLEGLETALVFEDQDDFQ